VKRLALVASFYTTGACGASENGPHLSEVIPSISAPGSTIEIRGDHFCGARADCVNVPAKIELGIDSPIEARVIAYADTSAMVEVPTTAPTGTTEIVLTVDGRSSNALAFTVGGIR